uniref:Piwi domain-containing protein n=1 Tax=Setaria viridis TaxID=4556 RepID=A0A4U6W2C5_SETVI|nr:hypothetical protein SEVIR_2G321800v2 [Setaria viridis]
MASHHRGGGRAGGGGRDQANPNVAQGGRAYGGGGGRGGQYYGDDSGGRGGGGRGFDGRGGGYHGGRDGGRGAGGYQGGRDGGGGRGYGGYQEGHGGGRGAGGYQGGRDGGRGGRGVGGYQQEGRGGGRGGYQGYGGRGGGNDYYGRGHGRQQSQRPDLRQAGPPLMDRYAAEAAALREKFKMMDIHRDAPMFPARPGFGTVGQPCVIKANHFFAGLVDKGLHHYDVTISPETTLKGVYRQVMSKLVSEKRQTELGGRLPAYDGRKSLFTAGELPFKSKEFEVTLPGRTERRYKVLIKHATSVSLHQLMMLMAGYHTDIPGQALQVLDIVLHDIVLNERNNMEYIAVGRSFFSPAIDTVNLGLGAEGWKGFYQSIRPTQMGLSVIVDLSSTAFVRPLPLIDFVMEILNKDNPRAFRSITNMDYVKIKKALRGVRVEVTHRGDACRKYRIATVTQSRPSVLDFESSSGVRKTVTDYFREAYQLEIQYDFLPCLQVGSDQRPNYLPMEVCKIVPGQQYQKKLESQQVSKLMDSICLHPSVREGNICQVVKHNDYNGTERANEFGLEVDYQPTSVQARVLPAPTLRYYGTGSDSICNPNGGHWNMINKKVVDGARVRNWVCINFCHDLHMNIVHKFCSDLVGWSCTTGLNMDNLRLPIFTARPDQVEADLRMRYQDARNKLGGQKIDLLLAILPEKNGSLYGNFKRICETEIGIMSQCCLGKFVTSARAPYFANVAIKINAKLGGRNTEFANPQQSLPVVSSEPTIIFGADVTHPAALDDTAPSIASVVASQDWPNVAKYNGVVRAQGHRQELIDGLEDIVKELLRAFEQGSRRRPKQLIFYRDGVSEGQFKQVLEQEIPEIEKAWKALYNEKPQITFIVVQKRHHTRLFPSDRRSADRTGNILPGTVIDRNICHPTEFDFFLCSHAGIKGTSRPTHYHVLRDDNKFTADGLQSLTYNLCYM